MAPPSPSHCYPAVCAQASEASQLRTWGQQQPQQQQQQWRQQQRWQQATPPCQQGAHELPLQALLDPKRCTARLCRYDTALEKANYAALAQQAQQASAAAPEEEEAEADDLEAQLARARWVRGCLLGL